jgi:hypothetical protein
MRDELRRSPRIIACCRALVRDPYGCWTGVTEDLCETGCRIRSPRLLRSGVALEVTLSSDQFPEELEIRGVATWAAPERLAIRFVGAPLRPRGLTPAQFVSRVVELGSVAGPVQRVLPALRIGRGPSRSLPGPVSTSTVRERPTPVSAGGVVVRRTGQ